MKISRAHHPQGLSTAVDRRGHRRRFHSRAGGRHEHSPAAETVAPARPPVWFAARALAADELPFAPSAFIFDVEGTLIDSALVTLQCWSETLADIGYKVSVADLHPYSGMDGKRMLRRLLNRHDPKLLEHVVKLQAERYRAHHLGHTRAFPGLRRLFTTITSGGAKIALATSCDKDELAHYRSVMNVDDLITCACAGDDVRREKPHPDVVALAARRLKLPPAQIAMVGDTPYDAEAARAAGVGSIGVQSGHFSRSDLVDAGCAAVFFDLQALARKLDEQPPAKPGEIKSHIAEAADSR